MDSNQITDMFEDDETQLKGSMPLKAFVRAKGETAYERKVSESFKVSGTEVKNYYVDVLGNESFKPKRCKIENEKSVTVNEVKKKEVIPQIKNLDVNTIMKAVETNDVSKLSKFLESNKDFVLNIKDQYGWTVMMSACCAGSKDIVKLLLKFHPNLNITDKTGNTCLKLAQSKGHKHIVNLLNDYLTSSKNKATGSSISQLDILPENEKSFYCETCKETFKESEQTHVTSTVHLFNSTRKSGIRTSYGIPENNVGFQMLLKTGWDREKGLGPEGSGHKFPPKTMLKQDRAGLGAKKYVARVTHDPHLVTKERIEKQNTVNKREKLQNEMKDRRKERELRRALDLN